MKRFLVMMFLVCGVVYGSDAQTLMGDSDLTKQELGVRRAALEPELAGDVITLMNKTASKRVKIAAIRTLGAYQNGTALKALVTLFKVSKGEDVQSAIIQALADFSDEADARGVALDALGSQYSEVVRSIAVDFWSKVKHDQAVSALISALGDQASVVRRKAIYALGERKEQGSVKALNKIYLNDTDLRVKQEAETALKKIGFLKTTQKSSTVALLLGVAPVNGLGLFYVDETALGIGNLVLEGLSVGMIAYGWSGLNQTNEQNELTNAGQHWTAIGGFILFGASYLFDIIYPMYKVNQFNKRQKERDFAFMPAFYTDGERTVLGFSINF